MWCVGTLQYCGLHYSSKLLPATKKGMKNQNEKSNIRSGRTQHNPHSKMTAHVFYYLAGTLGESAAHPNVFSVPTSNSAPTKLREIIASFPLSGSFHFRFKTKVKDYGFVWMDVNNPNSDVPKFGSSIFAKVLQLDKVRYSGVSRGRAEAGTTNPSTGPTSPSKRRQQRTSSTSSTTNTTTNNNTNNTNNKQTATRQHKQHTRTTKPTPSPSPNTTTTANQDDDEDDMFSFATNTNNASAQKKPIVSQLPSIASADVKNALGRLSTTDTSHKVHTKQLDMSDMSDSVKNKILKRQAEEQARIDTKLARHLLEAEQKEKDQLERDEVKKNLKGALLKWSGDPQFGNLKNIRTMLATMDSILWKGATWKTVGMSDLIQPNRVKISYYKAIRIAHPDRVQTGTVEEKYIASWMLDMLKLSWEQFKQKEM